MITDFNCPIEERINRIEKLLVESEFAETFETAGSALDALSVLITVTPEAASSIAAQTALATFVVLVAKHARGGVFIRPFKNVPNLLAQFEDSFFHETLSSLGAKLLHSDFVDHSQHSQHIFFGDACSEKYPLDFQVIAGRWWGGITAASEHFNWSNASPLGAIAAATVAAAESFFMLIDPFRERIRQPRWLELLPGCNPAATEIGPEIQFLPSSLSLVGLGHIGQANAWVIGMMPYKDRSAVLLQLIDMDRVGLSTPSTSVIAGLQNVGKHKTRVVSEWLERSGFSTQILEHRIDSTFHRPTQGPSIALMGVDNIPARNDALTAGYDLIIDSGLGSTVSNFDAMNVRIIYRSQFSAFHWQPSLRPSDRVLALPAYQSLHQNLGDPCGIVKLANKAVGAPFSGMAAACLSMSQLIRMLVGLEPDEIASTQLRFLPLLERSSNSRVSDGIFIEFQEVC